MKKAIWILLAVLPVPSLVAAKVCYSCKDKKPVEYVCAPSDTFTARKNAGKLGCSIASYSSSCKCGAEVSDKARLDLELERRYFGWL